MSAIPSSNSEKLGYSVNDKGEKLFWCRASDPDEFELLIEVVNSQYDKLPKSSATNQTKSIPSSGRNCPIHGVPMEQRFSEKKQKNYWAHGIGTSICFGN